MMQEPKSHATYSGEHIADDQTRPKWYAHIMSGTHTVTVGDRGRLVVPADVRERLGLTAGTVLVLVETPDGIVLLTRDQLRQRVREELRGADLVTALLSGRRDAAQREDAA